MKLLKNLLKLLLVFIVVAATAAWLYANSLKPDYEGELALKNLTSEVSVVFDDYGVPHITAQNQKDAYIALGYVHAQDRLWQMELIRRIAPGRLSEILGKDLVKTDAFFKSLGIEEEALKTIEGLDTSSEAYQLAEAYLEGINQYIEEGKTPIEFTMLGLEKETYTLNDVYNVFGYMAFSFAVAHKTDPLLQEVKDNLGANYLLELLDSYNENLIINKTDSISKVEAKFSREVAHIMENVPVPPLIGSNSWVIGPEKTKNGKVLLANDPHIGYAQPSVWYQNHIKTPDFEIYGFNIALMPFPLLGHNRNYAYGLTMLANDDLNFYKETNHPEDDSKYLTPEGYKEYQIRQKTIKVKDGKDTTITVKTSIHGPLINETNANMKGATPVAMNWIFTQLPNKTLDVAYGMSHANSLEEFKVAVAKIHAPGLNVMYGDAKGNIAWFAAAKLYELEDGLSTKLYLDGASGKEEIKEFYDFRENPKAVNPKWNYVYSANHQPDSVRGKLIPGYYQPENRSLRIIEYLEAKNDFTKDDVAKMIYDVTSSVDDVIAQKLMAAIDKSQLSPSEKKAISVLEKWEGDYEMKSVAPTIYNRFLYQFLVDTYKDELGDSFSLFINSQMQDHAMRSQVDKDNSVWWDNVNTENKVETKQEIITSAFQKSIDFLQNQLGDNVENWYWDRVITVEYEHAIGKAGGLLRKFFNLGPYKTVGGNEIINNQIFKLNESGIYNVTAGPSTRRVIDFSDIEHSLSVIPTGQSGSVFSEHYDDQVQKFLDGEFITMKLNKDEIQQNGTVLVLKPKE